MKTKKRMRRRVSSHSIREGLRTAQMLEYRGHRSRLDAVHNHLVEQGLIRYVSGSDLWVLTATGRTQMEKE